MVKSIFNGRYYTPQARKKSKKENNYSQRSASPGEQEGKR